MRRTENAEGGGARFSIDRGSPVPMYFQLAQMLEAEIASGRWPAGHQLDPEPALSDRYGVSRSVIRQALDRLERGGRIRRIKGRGTFVAGESDRSWRVQSSAGFFHEEVARLGHRVSSRILRAERGRLPQWAADALGQGPEGVTIERLRAVDGEVAMYNVNHLPAALAETVLGLDADDSLYARLEADHGIAVHGGRRVLEAVPAGKRLAELLEVRRGTSLIYIESVAWDAETRPFDCYRSWLRTDRTRIEVQVARVGDGGDEPRPAMSGPWDGDWER